MRMRSGRTRVRHEESAERRPGGRRVIAGLLPVFAITALTLAGPGLARAFDPAPVTVPVESVIGGAPNAAPAAIASAAADLLEQATAEGGTGYRFEIAQRSTLVALAGGPLIPVPDPDDRTKTIGRAERYDVGSLVETGFATPAGFSMEMRTGPAEAGAAVDLTGGELLFRTLVRDGKTFRDDGKGWYPTDQPPGVGLDPVTADLLPSLLRNAGEPEDIALATAEGDLGRADEDATRAIAATGRVADIPGVIAVDGADFTELTKPVAMTFDDAGRLVGLLVTARNTTVDAYDLVVVTEITLHYDAIPRPCRWPNPAGWTPMRSRYTRDPPAGPRAAPGARHRRCIRHDQLRRRRDPGRVPVRRQ